MWIVYFHMHSWKFHAKIRSRWKVIHIYNSCFFVFQKEIADCCSIRLATLLQKDCEYLLKTCLKIFQKTFRRKFGEVVKVSDCDAQCPGFESHLRQQFSSSRLNNCQKNGLFFQRLIILYVLQILTKKIAIFTSWLEIRC